ncbi:MAG: hypothetical protein A2287_09900 [Candidatus Melainabacteria bacterium RIFOXYA12_FULL_32_12]|nr:MAG: hypothetical protein A2255_01175 [Candidatus Melainabacteria bacterium RIFOXYA2_FULL_32_9]OGI31141.1 MAG: hypothetical protein A2287_09900 [Candidatus Melainabacteria bacterium RIFOXYA12_FULL_32_12]
MKKAFTLTEMLIVITIIGVLAAITTPILLDVFDEQDEKLYESAFKTVESVVSDLISDISLYPAGNFYNADAAYFCTNFSNKVNTVGTVDCTGSTVPGDPNFTTSNGMRWYGVRNVLSGNATIHVDIDGEGQGDDADASDILEIIITPTGKVTAPAGTETTYLAQ